MQVALPISVRRHLRHRCPLNKSQNWRHPPFVARPLLANLLIWAHEGGTSNEFIRKQTYLILNPENPSGVYMKIASRKRVLQQSVTFVKTLIRMNVRIYSYQQNYTNEYPNIFILIFLTRTNVRISIRIENCTNIRIYSNIRLGFTL